MYKTIIILFIFIPFSGFCQLKNFGTPFIHNYHKSEYKAGTQNWGISEDKNGFMYFANNDGVLRFDGLHWELLDTNIPLPVRSVFVDSNDRIFVGLIDNFGFLGLTSGGEYEFHSLRHLFDESVDFSDVWRINEIEQGIVFQSFEKLFIYDGNNIKVFSPKGKYRFSFNVNGRLYIQEHELGLFQYLNGVFEMVPWAEPLMHNEILSMVDIGNNNLLIGTERGFYKYINGILKEWKCKVNDFIKTNKLYSSASILSNYFAFGTILNGVVISDEKGNIVQHLNVDKGLQNNTILSVYSDANKNLWLGLDNGIDYVEINSPITYVSEGGTIGAGYCCVIHNDRIYLGTNQGLFVKSFNSITQNNESYKLIENTEGQVWSLTVLNNQLICGHNLGTFIINNEKANKISDEPGGWKYIRSKKDENTLIGGFYSGLAIFKYGQNGWRFYKKLNGFNESSRFLVEDEKGFFWISHGAKGIFRVSMNERLDSITSYKLYNQNSGLPSNEKNIIFPFKGEVLVSTIDGVYEYNYIKDCFEKSTGKNNLFGNIGRIKTLNPDEEGNIWYIAQNESGVMRLNEDLTYTKINSPFKKLDRRYINEFEFIYPYNNENVFIGIDNGFAHYTSKFPKLYSQSFPSFITKIELPYLDSVIFFNNSITIPEYKFPFRKNTIRFHFASPFFENLASLEFSYFLDNYSDSWSTWTKDGYKDFTNLNEGKYQFRLKARNIYGVESEISSFKFTILPPWYRSTIAYSIYLFLFVLLIFLTIRFILYRIDLSKKKENLKHQMELKQKEEQFQRQALLDEKEIIKLKNDKLSAEKVHRDKELANQTMGIIQKNKFLKKLNEELRLLQNSTEDASVRNKITILKRKILKESESDMQNKIFETYFDEVHEEFFNRLKEKYPQLSPNDLRLCAYLKMNISTKEISTLLNISYRGVEISRYRLRKKLELSRDINLSAFLLNL